MANNYQESSSWLDIPNTMEALEKANSIISQCEIEIREQDEGFLGVVAEVEHRYDKDGNIVGAGVWFHSDGGEFINVEHVDIIAHCFGTILRTIRFDRFLQ